MPEPKLSPDISKPNYRSELFTVRMWREVLNGHFEWRGKVLHSGTHKEHYFREWEALTAFIKKILADEDGKDGIPPPETPELSKQKTR